jgi:RNA polymerase sigma factor (sigma-70 family)
MGGALSEVPDSKSVTTEDLAKKDFLESKIQSALLRLSPNLRLVTVLRYIEGLSYAEIADTLSCSIGTIKSRLNRAHKNLEAILSSVIETERKLR